MFSVGDKISYPMHGAGIIQNIEVKDILGEEQQYYILKLPYNDMDVMIPVKKSTEIGIRPIISEEEMNQVFVVLCGETTPMPANWNKRQRDNLEKLKSGDIFKVAEVVRNLVRHEWEKGLSAGEKRMLANARQILESEMVMVFNISGPQAESLVDRAVGGEEISC